MTTTHALIDQLRNLGVAELRKRLAALDSEERALRILLRAALAAERHKRSSPNADGKEVAR
jgi:uncharacterized small protein (DUF1192 family)